MPLIESSVETLRADIAAGPSPLFVIFSSKPGDDGKPWCGFCVKAEPDIERIFAGEPYGLLVKYGPNDITDPANWVFEDWRLPGVPAIFRVEDGQPAPLPTTYTDDFAADLQAYIAGPDQWEEQLKKTEGDKYQPFEVRLAEHNAQFDKIKVLIAEHRAKEAAKKAEEEAKEKAGGGAKVCTGDVCLV
ncbi:uncharacterized protein LOC62_07G009757 [Vanrija pseudolonga]|uniref:Thioredoxin domain-containing protein n=1 Tax=Vanrija pseudolonga TaxID=143232 RepID=A0AAF0YGD7_9TREE|nr:hypothetical protein LOC62_07G009757 [Vanrija pseudolonga]